MKIWLFKPTKIYQNVMNRFYVILLLIVLFCGNASGQRVISGQVFETFSEYIDPLRGRIGLTRQHDERGNRTIIEPKIGAIIRVKGTDIWTHTGIDGNFRIEVDTLHTNTTLIFSSLGLETQTINIGNASIINVVLQPRPYILDEFFTLNAFVHFRERFIDGRRSRECQLIRVEKQWGERDLQTFDSTFFLNRINININNLEQFVCNRTQGVIVVRFRLNVRGDIIDADIVRGIDFAYNARLLNYEILTAFQSAPRLNCRVLNHFLSRYQIVIAGGSVVRPSRRARDIILPIRIRITEVHQ